MRNPRALESSNKYALSTVKSYITFPVRCAPMLVSSGLTTHNTVIPADHFMCEDVLGRRGCLLPRGRSSVLARIFNKGPFIGRRSVQCRPFTDGLFLLQRIFVTSWFYERQRYELFILFLCFRFSFHFEFISTEQFF